MNIGWRASTSDALVLGVGFPFQRAIRIRCNDFLLAVSECQHCSPPDFVLEVIASEKWSYYPYNEE
jgi:hypothetical protein